MIVYEVFMYVLYIPHLYSNIILSLWPYSQKPVPIYHENGIMSSNEDEVPEAK